MRRLCALVVLIAWVTAWVPVRADDAPDAAAAELQRAEAQFADGHYREALDGYTRALTLATPVQRPAARAGIVRASLRVADFPRALHEATQLAGETPTVPSALALEGDALWSSGQFDEAAARYEAALQLDDTLARGHHGRARTLAARGRLPEALQEVRSALRLTPEDLELHHTLGTIYERLRRYPDAVAAFAEYIRLLPDADHSENALWARAQVAFLRSFGDRQPYATTDGDDAVYTVGFRLVNDKVIVKARVNGGRPQDFVVDTGAELTVITRPTARRRHVDPVTYTLSAGVGDVGLRGLQLARIASLQVGGLTITDVPTVIKDPPLTGLPVGEKESLSPLALGYSMVIDYRLKRITFGKHLPSEPADYELPLWLNRLATVRGTVDGHQSASFVVDTGGQVVSISSATAATLQRDASVRRIPLRVFGSSGWDRDAFLMPSVQVAFDHLQLPTRPVVVLNLDSPSVLLGFQVGGIIGHHFLSRYRVAIDVEHGVLRLTDL